MLHLHLCICFADLGIWGGGKKKRKKIHLFFFVFLRSYTSQLHVQSSVILCPQNKNNKIGEKYIFKTRNCSVFCLFPQNSSLGSPPPLTDTHTDTHAHARTHILYKAGVKASNNRGQSSCMTTAHNSGK